MKKTKVAIIGSGPAGFTAAIYAGRASLEPVQITGAKSGGQLMWTTDIENFPGFPQGINGPQLMMDMRTQAERFGTIMVDQQVTASDFSARPFKLWTNLPVGVTVEEYERAKPDQLTTLMAQIRTGEPEIIAETVIITTGAESIMLGVPGEMELLGRGVSTCAVCDAAFYRDKITYVVGGGDSAMEDTLALTKFAREITVVHRRDSFKASKIMQDRVLNHPKVKVLWNSTIEQVKGTGKVETVVIKTGEATQELPADGVFIAVGHKPMSALFDGSIKRDSHGYIVTRASHSQVGLEQAQRVVEEETGLVAFPTMTTVEGVFAAGDVVDVRYKQAITAAAQGCMAALDAERFLEKDSIDRNKTSMKPAADVYQQSVDLHRHNQGKLEVHSLIKVTNKEELSLAYSPEVAEPCRVIQKDPHAAYDLTMKGRTVAVISDGTAVLGLGDIGPAAGLPVMEGKALLLKEFGGVDAVPLVIDTKESLEIINFVKYVAPTFAGINLEDISAPRCFEIEESLQDIGIPVFHDDQHGTAIIVTAALHNAAKVVGKNYADLNVVIIGAGAAGLAVGKMLLGLDCKSTSCRRLTDVESVHDVVLLDSKSALHPDRDDLNMYKMAFALSSNKARKTGALKEVIKGADVVIGLSKPGLITTGMIQSMADKAIVFALANPTPEIMPDEAKAAGATVVATGRSDFANQINNVLAFPGIFRAVIDGRLKQITTEMKITAAEVLAAMVPEPTAEMIVPNPFTPHLAERLSQEILKRLPS